MEDERDIEDVLLHLAAEDKIDLSLGDEGQMSAKLTDSGLTEAEGLIGGKDVGEAAQAFIRLLEENGDLFGRKLEADERISTWLKIVTVMAAMKSLGFPLPIITERLNAALDAAQIQDGARRE